MSETKKTKRTFEIQSAALDRVRLVEQPAAASEPHDPESQPEISRRGRKSDTPEPELIIKLIDFIKSI
jgi:hypothetical protein